MAHLLSADHRPALRGCTRLAVVTLTLSALSSLTTLTALSAASFDCAKAKSALAELTFKALKAQVSQEMLIISSAQELVSLVSNVKAWGLSDQGLNIDFNPEDVAPVAGAQSVMIPWAQLSEHLK